MTTPKSIKTACIVSLASIAVWFLAVAVIDIFQDKLIVPFYPGADFGEDTGRIFLASTAVNIIIAAVIAACSVLMIYGKTTLIPLILSGSAALLNPIISNFAHTLQVILAARLQGEDAIARIDAVTQITSYASYILNAAFLCTVAASAVYAYAKKKGHNNENPENP